MPLIIGVIIFSAVILGFNYGFITLNLPGSNNHEQTLPEQVKSSEPPRIVSTPAPTPVPTLVIKQPVNDNARQIKERELERIDKHIEMLAKEGLEDGELRKGFVETFKKCESEWCRDSLRKEIDWIDKIIQDTKDQIEALELQRATIVSGL